MAEADPVPVSVEAKLSFIEPGCRWTHSPSSPLRPWYFLPEYYENLCEDVKNLRRFLTVIWCFFLFPQALPLSA